MKNVYSLKWLKVLLLVLFVGYYVGGTAFTHTHYYLNYSVTHSHPYLPGADGLPHHDHSSSSIYTIEDLTSLCVDQVSYQPLFLGLSFLGLVFVLYEGHVLSHFLWRDKSRAPPMFNI